MKFNNYILTFCLLDKEQVVFSLADGPEEFFIRYDKRDEDFYYDDHTVIAGILVRNQFQLKKIIRSALKGQPAPGDRVNCVLIDQFTFLNYNDYNHFIRVDRRWKKPGIDVSETGTSAIHKIYVDGSYACDLDRSAYAGIIEDTKGNREIYHAFLIGGSSNLMELLAVTEGLRRLGPVKKVQINTDSRFVIRGLAQWIHFWKLNDWQTAHGRKVKLATYWQQADQLCKGKLLELKWIKSRSGDINQDFCHRLAKQIATG